MRPVEASYVSTTKRAPRATGRTGGESGARACLLGPNGAGKSTSIRLLEGALQPTAGRVSLLGAAVTGRDYLAARRRVGVVPQGPGMYRDLSVRDYLELARRLYGRGDVDQVIDAMGLTRYRDRALTAL